MPRTLPWLPETSKKKEGKQASCSRATAKRKRAKTPEDEELNLVNSNSDLDAVSTTDVSTLQRRKAQRANRTPSTSPPPAPPDVEIMHEGYAADDAWRMVEDEFLATAKLYTKTIHHAEYVRLKKLAKSRGNRTLDDITRQTDGRTEQSIATNSRLKAEERGKKIKAGMRKIDASYVSSSDEDEYMQDPQLAGLMMGSRKASADLRGMGKAKSNTRSAAGFAHSAETVRKEQDRTETATSAFRSLVNVSSSSSNEVSDDLDAAPSRKPKNAANGEGRSKGTAPSNDVILVGALLTGGVDLFKQFTTSSDRPETSAKPAAHQSTDTPGYGLACAAPNMLRGSTRAGNQATKSGIYRSQKRTTIKEAGTSEADVGGFGRRKESVAAAEYLAKRRADREKRKKEEQQMSKGEVDVPTFAI